MSTAVIATITADTVTAVTSGSVAIARVAPASSYIILLVIGPVLRSFRCYCEVIIYLFPPTIFTLQPYRR